jgi:hypothetical protein
MQALAAELSGYAGNFTAFWGGEFKNSLFRFIYFKTGSSLKTARCAERGFLLKSSRALARGVLDEKFLNEFGREDAVKL